MSLCAVGYETSINKIVTEPRYVLYCRTLARGSKRLSSKAAAVLEEGSGRG